MKNSKKNNQNNWLKLFLFIVFGFLLYFLMRQYIGICELGGRLMNAVSLKTFIDDWMPLNLYIVWPYVAALFYVPFAGILYAFNPKISAIQVLSFYVSVISMFLISYVIYIIFPTTASEVMITSFDPNSQIFVSAEMFQSLQAFNQSSHPLLDFIRMNVTPLFFIFQNLQSFYASSTPLGDFPSIHVAPLVFMGIFLYKHWRSLFWIFLPLAFFGAIGTFILKFHTVAGFLGGIIMGYFGYYVLYRKVFFKYFNNLLLAKEEIR